MTQIQQNYKEVLESVQDATLVAISKYHPEEELMEAYECGCRVFGESQVQELQRKHTALPADIEWHFIGHLQRNKVSKIVPFVSLIHSVDSQRLLEEINKQAVKIGRRVPVLLQLHIACEETKFGFSEDELTGMLSALTPDMTEGIEFRGIMAMASNVDDDSQVETEFRTAERIFNTLKNRFFATDDVFCIKSYGMSGDYPIALRCGSNMVRVGTRIFGEREY